MTVLKPFFGVFNTLIVILGVPGGVDEVGVVVGVKSGFFLGVVDCCCSFPLGDDDDDDEVVVLFWRFSGSSLMITLGLSELAGVALVLVMNLRFFKVLGLSLIGVFVDIVV